MRFRTYDELTDSMEVDRALLHLAAFRGVFSRSAVEVWRRRTGAFAEYVGLFAEDRGRLIGQMFVLHVPYTFPGGREIVSGIAAVGTRPDRGRAGVARRLLEEVHRREKSAGVRFSTLWTNRSWGAHGLYEKLGYRDVYSSPWSVHAPLARRPRRPRGARPARRSDLGEIERFHTEQTLGRLGFLRGTPGYLAAEVATGDLDPAKELVVLRSQGRLRGYAHLEVGRPRIICGELVAASEAGRRALVAEVGRRAGRRAFAFQQTPVTDSPALFRGPGFSTSPSGWYVFMASPLGRSWTTRRAISEFATQDRRFVCMAGDRF